MQLYLNKSYLFVIFSFSFLIVIVSTIPPQAFGDGFAQENLPPASVGNRKVSLFIKLNPTVITSANLTNRYIFLRLFDANTNQTIVHDSFFITVTKNNDNDLLMRDLFHTHTGELTLEITPTGTIGHWNIFGDTEPILGGWMNQAGGPVEVQAPILGEGGLYHFHIELFSIDYDNNIFATQDAPQFDAYLSVGDVSNSTVSYQNNSYNTKLISYYDKTGNFTFDQSKLQFSWTMPFAWNRTVTSNVPLFVHEELHVPKSFTQFSGTPTYNAEVNGNPIVGRRMIVDPYSLGDSVIVHLLLNKFDLANYFKNIPVTSNTMTFQVSPAAANVKTSSELLTDFGGWGIKLGWSPTNLTANSVNNLKLTFFDAFTEQQVTGDVNYDLKIFDTSSDTLFSKTSLTAKGGSDTQSLNLPSNGVYNIQVTIKSIVNNGLPDTSRIGMGRGTIVIPSTVTTETSSGSTHAIQIPTWVKNNAGWWANGQIRDSDFVKGIQYLIKQGIMVIPPTQNGQASTTVSIPSWVKNNAMWWSNNQISDSDFVKGIQYLITSGIMTIQ